MLKANLIGSTIRAILLGSPQMEEETKTQPGALFLNHANVFRMRIVSSVFFK